MSHDAEPNPEVDYRGTWYTGGHQPRRPDAIPAGDHDGAGRFAGFCPDGSGHRDRGRVQKPLATVVIGGLLSAMLLTILVLPALVLRARLFEGRNRPRRQGVHS